MKYQIAPATNGQSLSGIFTIERHATCDEILVGKTFIGYITESIKSDVLQYQFTPDFTINEFPWRSTYESVWLDVLIHIANSSDLAIEFTIAVTNKIRNAQSKSTVEPLVTEGELF